MLTAQQLEDRRHGIGGSDAGAVLGLNPYRTPLDVYREKTGEADPPDLDDVEAVRWGNLLEDTLAREYSTRTGHKVRRRNRAVVHPELPFIRANLDRTVDGERKVLEIKTAGYWARKDWGPAGSDHVPDAYLAQVMHQMLATGYREADLCVLIGGQEFRIYHLGFDQELADLIVDKETWFWRECVEKRMPPPPTTFDDLKALYPTDDGGIEVATPEILDAIAELKQLKEQGKEVDQRQQALELAIKAQMGDAATLTDEAGNTLATWKTQQSTRLDQKALKAEEPDTFERFQTTSTMRVLRLKGGRP